MSEENVEVVRTALTALDHRDVESYLSVASPDIELVNPASALEGPSIGNEALEAAGLWSSALRSSTTLSREPRSDQPVRFPTLLGESDLTE